jgi:hypothetical protein
MTEPDQIEFHEQLVASGAKPGERSMATRVGIVAGSAALVVVGAVAAMGASPAAPAPPIANGSANLLEAVAPNAAIDEVAPFDYGFRGGMFGRGGFHDITITAINGSSLSLATDDGWTRTITVGSSTTITKGGDTIAVGDLSVGDQIRFGQEKATDGTYTITAIKVVLPSLGGEVTAVGDNTITVTGKDGTTGTIHVDGDTTYQLNGADGQTLSDITVGSVVVAEGTLRSDGSLDADAVYGGMRGMRGMHDGMSLGPGFDKTPDAAPTPTPSTTAS